ncbi:hypothetical protein NHX12_023377 [Muraenolepis orangiensis]|uniref:S100/CaBP-9k-type calcium binding subdomain domain-containing protein n=1 Tax=Muraenolepis orangiensis TaxID=630683 RepID=A0A9Q0IPZ2_9TELE|nr:hypothetical protein NHX12_023377 [Muraenolepis orangiensis]
MGNGGSPLIVQVLVARVTAAWDGLVDGASVATPHYAWSSGLEKAISTLVSEFHKAGSGGATLKTEEFKGLVSTQLPTFAKTVGSDQGWSDIMQKMGVSGGEGISFERFWGLIQGLATTQHGLLSMDKVSKCTCIVLQKPPQAQVAVQDTIQEDNQEAEKATCDEVQNLTPVKEEKPGQAADADVHTLTNSDEAVPGDVSRSERCPSPPLEHPASPSRYMRRLPPPPGFYLPKEHSYAQLCPLLWRRRYERAVDCLEKALRQLSAARRRENRLRAALSRLREKRLRHAPQDGGQKAKGDWLAGRRSRVGAAVRAGVNGLSSVQREEGEFDMESEEARLCEDAIGEPTDWARCLGPNTFSEEEPGENYCFNCNRAGEGDFGGDTRPVPRAVKRNVRSVARNGTLKSQEETGKQPRSHKDMFMNVEGSHEQHVSSPDRDVHLVVLEGPLGDGFKTSLHLQSTLKPPPSQSLLQTQQVILDAESLRNSQVHHLQPARSDFALVGQTKDALFYKEPCQQVYFVQESTEGQLLLVPATTQDRLKGVDRTDDGAENVQTILQPQITFHPGLGQIGERNHGIEPSNGTIASTVVREDVRDKLKEHLEGFQLQLSTEYIT